MSAADFRTSDLRFYKTVQDLKAEGAVCVGVYIELRGNSEEIKPILTGGDSSVYIGFHARTTADTDKVGNVYDMTSQVVYWEYDSVSAAGGIGFSRDVTNSYGAAYSNIEETAPILHAAARIWS